MSRKNLSTKKVAKNNATSKNNNSKSSRSNSALKMDNAMRTLSNNRKRGAQKQQYVAAAYATGQVGKAPVISMKKRGCRIVHRELIASVTGTVAFTVAQSFALNPGIPQTFPWLSLTAQNWEQYRFNKLKFCYYTRTGSNVPGSMMMAPDYDAADAAPTSEQIASSYEDVAEDAPWKDIDCNLPAMALNATEKRKFVRTGGLAANLDIKTYDSGNLHLITLDGTAVSWGKLWVEYDIELFNPQLPPQGSIVFGGIISGGGTETAANPLGTVPVLDLQANGITVDALSNVTFQNPGTYLVSTFLAGTVITASALTASAGNTVASEIGFITPAAATTASQAWRVVVTAPSSVAFSATATTITAASFIVGQAPLNSLA